MLQVNRSGYYAWTMREESQRAKENHKMAELIKTHHKISRQSYGSRRHASKLFTLGFNCGRYRARSIMRAAGIEAKQKKRFKATTDSNHNKPVFSNLVKRRFSVSTPDEIWVSDITYIKTLSGWLYLAVVIDLFNRELVGWSMNDSIDRQLVINATRMAVWRRKPLPGLIFHSDRGSQYCSKDFRKYLKGHGIIGSMSRKGNCWDNAVAESFFSSLKKERVYSEHYRSKEEAKSDIVDYIEMFYNNFRGHSFLGNLSPKEFIYRWKNEKKVA